jgi:hypothetical protein
MLEFQLVRAERAVTRSNADHVQPEAFRARRRHRHTRPCAQFGVERRENEGAQRQRTNQSTPRTAIRGSQHDDHDTNGDEHSLVERERRYGQHAEDGRRGEPREEEVPHHGALARSRAS